MVKKGAKSSGSRKERTESGSREKGVQKILIENFVSLQDVMTGLSGKLNNLTNQISKLLELFEQSARTFMEKDLKMGQGTADRELISKLDRLLEQNKVIAQGIAMIHEEYSSAPEGSAPAQAPMPSFVQQTNHQENVNKYQRSISSKQDGKIQTGQAPGQ